MKLSKLKVATIIGLASLMAFAGAVSVLVSATDQITAASDSTASQSQYNMTLQVKGFSNGESTGASGAMVEIWSCTKNETSNQITVTITKVASGTTDSGGNVTFKLPKGGYLIVANNTGVKAISKCNLDCDSSRVIHMDGQPPHQEMLERYHCRMPMCNNTLETMTNS